MAVLAVLLAACGGRPAAPAPAERPNPAAVLSITSTQRSPDGTGETVTFTEAGLEAGASVTIVLTAEANSTFDCVDAGGRVVPPRVPLIAQVSEVQRFRAGADGKVTGSLTVQPPSTVQVPCAGSLRPRLATIAYQGLRLSDVTNQVEVVLPA